MSSVKLLGPPYNLTASGLRLWTEGIWRYALNAPLIWSDEFASVLLLWLVMFGTAIAHLRNQQMRVTTIVDWLPAHWRQHVDTFASMVVAA